MLIGVDASCWQNKRGYGRHARALLSALVRMDSDNRYVLIMDSQEATNTVPVEAQLELVRTTVPTVTAAAADGHRSLMDVWRMSKAMSASKYDLLLFPTVYSYVPVIGRAKKVVMIHDVIADVYPHLTLPSWTARLFWKIKVALGLWQADTVVTVSHYSRSAIVKQFSVPEDKIFVVGEASDPIFKPLLNPRTPPSLQKAGIRQNRRALVYVGGFGLHKNLDMLVTVFAKLAVEPKFKDVDLIMVGDNSNATFYSAFDALEKKVFELGLTDRVIFTGFLRDEDLVVLLNKSLALVLPSLMEGFGLPAVEAAACGCPVVATNASPLPELLGEGGLYIDPNKPESLQFALIEVLESPSLRKRMSDAGLAAARDLTWDLSARQMINLLNSVDSA